MEDLNFSNQNGNGVHSPTLRDLVAIAFRYRRLMALSFAGIFLGAILVAVLQSNRYQAGMKILVKRERVDPIVSTESSGASQFAPGVTEEEINSEMELLRSKDLLEKLVVACNLQQQRSSRTSRVLAAIGINIAGGTPETLRIARAVRRLQTSLKVEVIPKTNLIAVNYESSDPRLAAQVLATLGNLYLEKHLAVHRPPGALDFFQQETREYRKGLTAAETRLVDFTQDERVVSAQLEKEVALQKLAEFDSMLKQTEVGIKETQQRIHILEEQMASASPRMVTQVRNLDDASYLSQLKSNLLTLELKRTELLGKFEPTYRPIQELDAQITQTRAALALAEKSQLHEQVTDRDPTYELLREELAKAKADLGGLQARATATAMTVRTYQENARSLGQKEIIQNDLIRNVKATEESYGLYLRKAEEARMSDALDRRRIINVAIAEAATVPSLPSNQRFLTVFFGLLLATLVSAGVAFGSEYMDPTFRTSDEVTAFLNIPVLATMPQKGRNGTAIHV